MNFVSLILLLSFNANASLDCRNLFHVGPKHSYVHHMQGDRELPKALEKIEKLYAPTRELVGEKRKLEEKKLALQKVQENLTWREKGIFKRWSKNTDLLQRLKDAEDEVEAAKQSYFALRGTALVEKKKQPEILKLVTLYLAKPIFKILKAGLIEKNASWLRSLKIEDVIVTQTKSSIIGTDNEVRTLVFLTAEKDNEYLRFFISMHVDYTSGEIKRAALIDGSKLMPGSASKRSVTRAKQLLKIGSLMNPELTDSVDNLALETSVKSLKLNTSAETLERIQLRSHINPAIGKQAQQVLNYVQSSRKQVEPSFLESYLFYLAYGDASLIFIPPTHWVFFHLSSSQDQQTRLGHVFSNFANHQFQSPIEVKDEFDKSLTIQGISSNGIPLEVKQDPTQFDFSNLTPNQQEILTDRISDSVDHRKLTRIDDASGATSISFLDDHHTKVFNDSTSASDHTNAYSYSHDTSYDTSVSVDAGGGGGGGGGGD
ncbi:MAG: hypothetical protein A4S09_09995 [Proteobacteria bacterium SG_bin7]|nr:MAG: hypothetical protein A4S09_09995 [Proteobacteria bacterium SG_bin7]